MPLRELWKSVKLPFQKLDTMLLNDIRLFIRDRKSLVLVMLTPFIILSILINIFYFSDVAETIKGVKLGVCDLDDSNFKLESDIFETVPLDGECGKTAADKVANGELRASVVIPEGFSSNIKEGKGTELKLYVDNSKSTTAVVASNAMKAYVSDLNEKIGTEFILNAWDQLKKLNENLKFLVANLEKAKPVAIDLRTRLNDINADIGSVDFASQQQSLSDLIYFLDLMDSELGSVNATFADMQYLPPVPTIDYSPDASVALTEYELSSKTLHARFCNESGMIPLLTENPVCSIIDYTDKLAGSLASDVANLSVKKDDMNARISEFNRQVILLNDTLFRISEFADKNSAKNADLRSRIALVRENLLFLEDKTSNISRSIIELNQSVNRFLSDIVRVTDELNATIEVLDTYTKKDPATILKPVKIDEMPVFKDKLEIFYRLPALISMILLFITLFISSSLIVNERRGGTMARIFLSPISMFFYVFEKMLYLLLLCVLAVLSMLLAAFVFKVSMAINHELFIVFIVSSLVYISMGILVGSISKSENTSLLTCLVLGFPLMFMCGAFSPPELMSGFMRIASEYLPLTMNINLLESITIYHTTMNVFYLQIMAGIILFFYVLSVFMIRSRPTLK